MIPNDDYMSGYIALSPAASERGIESAILITLDPSGVFKACNSSLPDADVGIPYRSGKAYYFDIDVNIPSGTYSVTITPESSDSRVLATNYAFCGEWTDINGQTMWSSEAFLGSCQVCGFGAGECSADWDDDGVVNCDDECPNDPGKSAAGVCGCGVEDLDLNGDGTVDCGNGDGNADQMVDLLDYALFFDCLGGPGGTLDPSGPITPAACGHAFDLDHDEDVDITDLAGLLTRFTDYIPQEPAPGDANGDGAVDLYDYSTLYDCLYGPDVAPDPGLTSARSPCLDVFDFDEDADVDARDLSYLLMSFEND
jgi:hypothetical protein